MRMSEQKWWHVEVQDNCGAISPVTVAKSNDYIVWIGVNGEAKKHPKTGLHHIYTQDLTKAVDALKEMLEEC